jgi:hypothetical protein
MKTVGKIAAAIAILLTGFAGEAAVIYNNSTTRLGNTRFDTGTREVGDEVRLTQTDLANRMLSRFSFEYYATNASGSLASSTISVTVRLYANNSGSYFNGYTTPGTVLWQSLPFSIGTSGTAASVLDFSFAEVGSGTIQLPSTNLTWSVQFSNLGAGDQVGLSLYTPPTVGQNYSDYWERTITGWQLYTNSGAIMSFGATIEAIPEPQVAYLVGIGGLLGLALGRRFMRKS